MTDDTTEQATLAEKVQAIRERPEAKDMTDEQIVDWYEKFEDRPEWLDLTKIVPVDTLRNIRQAYNDLYRVISSDATRWALFEARLAIRQATALTAELPELEDFGEHDSLARLVQRAAGMVRLEELVEWLQLCSGEILDSPKKPPKRMFEIAESHGFGD